MADLQKATRTRDWFITLALVSIAPAALRAKELGWYDGLTPLGLALGFAVPIAVVEGIDRLPVRVGRAIAIALGLAAVGLTLVLLTMHAPV